MKKAVFFIFIALSALVVNAQGPFGNGGCGGGGNGFPGDTTWTPGDSIGHPGGHHGHHGHPGDSTWTPGDSIPNPWGGHDSTLIPCDSLGLHGGHHGHHGHPGHPTDSTWTPGDSIPNHWGGNGGGGCGHDSTFIPCDSLNHHGFGHHGHHGLGHHGDSTCVPNDTCHAGAGCVINAGSKDASIQSIVIENVNLYPNPVVNQVNVDFTSDGSDRAEVMIFSINGQRVNSRTVEITEGSNRIQCDVSKLPEGIYILRLNSGTSAQDIRFVK